MSGVPKVRLTNHAIPSGWAAGIVEQDYEYSALLASEPHWRLPNGSWSGGGPFYVVNQRRETKGSDSFSWRIRGNSYNWTAVGVSPLWSSTVPSMASMKSSFPTYAKQISDSKNRTSFVSMWNRTVPGQPAASLGQTLIELADFPKVPLWDLIRGLARSGSLKQVPEILKNQVKDFQNLGSEYLNVKFGWQPFVRDLQDVYRLTKSVDKQLAQIVRDNGKSIGRKIKKASEVSVTSYDPSTGSILYSGGSQLAAMRAALAGGSYNWACANVGGVPTTYQGSSSVTRVKTTTETRWYSASYSYYIPNVNSWGWKTRTVAALYGVLPSPDLVWQIMPWSWLVDWFTNIGDTLKYHGLGGSAIPSVVARRAYQMVQRTETDSASSSSSWPATNNLIQDTHVEAGSLSITTTNTRETKMRMGATPFGLGSSYSSLSGGQYAILAALGMSRSNF